MVIFDEFLKAEWSSLRVRNSRWPQFGWSVPFLWVLPLVSPPASHRENPRIISCDSGRGIDKVTIWKYARVFCMIKAYLEREQTLSDPYSTWGKGIYQTPAGCSLPMSLKVVRGCREAKKHLQRSQSRDTGSLNDRNSIIRLECSPSLPHLTTSLPHLTASSTGHQHNDREIQRKGRQGSDSIEGGVLRET